MGQDQQEKQRGAADGLEERLVSADWCGQVHGLLDAESEGQVQKLREVLETLQVWL